VKLYKYVTEERISILKNGLIRFSQPQVFNDPFELKPQISSVLDDAYLKEDFDAQFSKITREEYDSLPAYMRGLVSFAAFRGLAESKREQITQGMKLLSGHAAPHLKDIIYKGLEKHIGILSLTENPKNLLMWAHYANRHQGFVIEFDATHPFFDQRKSDKDEHRFLKKVTYSEKRPDLCLSKVESFDEFLVKGADWSYEQEQRMLVSLADADSKIHAEPNDIYLFKVPFGAINSVLIGARATVSTVNNIEATIAGNSELKHIRRYKMEIHAERFDLVMA
jgi:hypothetical protein